MYLFLDTEFSSKEDGSHELVSIGLCGPHDEEFYAENILASGLADDFLIQHVFPQLGVCPGIRGDLQSIAKALVEWLNGFARQRLEICYDFHADFDFVEQLLPLSTIGLDVPVTPSHVGYLLEDTEGIAAAAECWHALESERSIGRHHALADALALRARFRAVHG